ncbi:MAG: hypothetical protein KH033_02920 [Clostridiales bacterium]|nr:hypothetical protein [Clostridiales bacterium]
MAKIEAALPSPRIMNGIIAWYCMDEFEIGLSIKLYDADGEEISLGTEDTVEVIIKNNRGEDVKTFEFTNVKENFINLVFNKDETILFDVGTYFYDIRILGKYNRTIVKNNIIKVE